MVIKQTVLLPSDRNSGICHQMAPLRMLYIVTLTYIFNATQFLEIIIFNIWKAVRARKKMMKSFIEVNNGNRMAPLRMLYIVTVIYILKVTQFLEIILYNIWNTVRACEQCSGMPFIEVDIRYRPVCLVLSPLDLGLNCQGQTFKIWISLKQ